MSLRAIKEALAVVAAIKAPGGPMAEIHAKAQAGVEALEKAAKVYVKERPSDDEWDEMYSVLSTIAKEAE